MSYTCRSRVRQSLAVTLRRNWLATHGTESETVDLDESLTHLDWLTNFTPSNDKPANTTRMVYTEAQGDHFMAKMPIDVDYKTSSSKPPHSYAKLITMAIMDSEKKMLVLSDIYKWMTDNFSYYNNTSSNWHNSVRHNLSMNKNFKKVPRRGSDRSKGRYWTIFSDVDHLSPNTIHHYEHEKRNLQSLNDDDDVSFVSRKRIKTEKENRNLTESKDILSAALNMSDLQSFAREEQAKTILCESRSKSIHLLNCNSSLQRREKCSQSADRSLISSDEWSSRKKSRVSDDGRDSLMTSDFLMNEKEHWTETLLDTDLLLSDYDPKLKSVLNQPADLPLDLSTIDKDTMDDLTWERCHDDDRNGTSVGIESRLSTPSRLSDDEQRSTWNDELTLEDDMMSYFEKDINDIFETIPVFPTSHSDVSLLRNELFKV